MSFLGSIGSAIGGVFSSVAGDLLGNWQSNQYSKAAASKQFERELYLMDKQFDNDLEMWNKQNEYNSPANQMKRLQDAGLNPNLMYSNGNAGNATSMPTMSKGSVSMASAPRAKYNIDFSKLMPLMQMENLNAQNKLINAQTIEAEERAKGVTLDNIRKGIDNTYMPEKYDAEINRINEETKNIPYSNPIKAAVKSTDTFLGNWNSTVDYDNNVPAPLEMAYRKRLYQRWGKNAMKHYKKPVDRRPGDFK